MELPDSLDDFKALLDGDDDGVWLQKLRAAADYQAPKLEPVGAVPIDDAERTAIYDALERWSRGVEQVDALANLRRQKLLHWLVRPALRLRRDGKSPFEDLPSPAFEAEAAAIGDILRAHAGSIGRVEIGERRVTLGTAWVADRRDDLMVLRTARHVVIGALTKGWATGTSLALRFDTVDPDALGPEVLLDAKRAVKELERDCATIELEVVAPFDVPRLPIESVTDFAATRPVLVVGHPNFGPKDIATVRDTLGFDEVPAVKRASPGRVRTGVAPQHAYWKGAFVHDATTLGGSSGAPVFALDSKKVIGLHVGGLPLDGQKWFAGNFALPQVAPA